MGRVYEALKRAAENGEASQKNEAVEKSAHTATVAQSSPAVVTAGNRSRNDNGDAPERVIARGPLFASEVAQGSAFNEHTGDKGVGTALPVAVASRDAGATLDAVSSTRPPEFLSYEISAARVEPHLIAITQPRSPHCEQFRSLRTRVLHAGERRRMQAFVITSANVMEGKTMTALNLAWLLGQTDGVRALLVDGDLRHPCAAEYLGMDAPTGLAEVLAGEANLADTIVRLEPAGLHLLPGGTVRDDVAELISGPKFSRVLNELRRVFNYIIIDAPPLSLFTDATVMINRADGALLVVRAGRTKYSELDRLLEPLPHERLLGVVMNGSNEQLNENTYYYQRRYYKRDAEVVKETKREEEVTTI